MKTRRAFATDLPRLLELERRIFPDPWSREMFLEQMAEGLVLVASLETRSPIFGYVAAVREYRRVHITNLAVERGERRRGSGRRLLDAVLDAGRRDGARSALLEVRASNAAAAALYTAAGFRPVGRRAGFYPRDLIGAREDAVVYRLELHPLSNQSSP